MDVAVLIKQVPVSNDVSVGPETHALIHSSSEGMINSADLNAIEAAMALKERTGGKVAVFTMGFTNVEKALRDAMALGYDESCLITDRCLARGDTIATAKVLAGSIEKYEKFDPILNGTLSADGATGQVGAMVAEYMGIPHVAETQGLSYDEDDRDCITAVRKYQGMEWKIKTALPALVSVCFGSNEPRLATLRPKKAAKSEPLEVYANADLKMATDEIGLPGSPTIVTDSFQPESARRAQMLSGTPEEPVAKLKELIETEKGKEQMANGICVFAENYNESLEPVVAELVRAAHCIKETTGGKIQVAVLAEDCKALATQLGQLGFDEIYAVETSRNRLFQDDTVSQTMTEILKRIDPSSVLIPATPTGRSVFSRVAAHLGCGMTADCAELAVDTREDRTFFIKQNKPSFGENVFVTIVIKEGVYPQMMTVRPGVYTLCEVQEGRRVDVAYYRDIILPGSGIQVISSALAMDNMDSILTAEVVVMDGRGAESEENFTLLKAFAEKLGAAIRGTRPLAGTGFIPPEHRIGQTGFMIRPKVRISLDVSGAIQHTEGIRDTKLFVVINQDESAPIFNIADYGMTYDMKDVLETYLKL